jgi:hypothetical protein
MSFTNEYLKIKIKHFSLDDDGKCDESTTHVGKWNIISNKDEKQFWMYF